MITTDAAKTILCYGDSNTWGNIPRTDHRYPRSVRWPGALQNVLGENYEVISEGLCGRTFVAEDPKKPHRTGITHLQAILESADPVDTLIIMLGTNDVKSTYTLSAEQIAGHLEQTIDFIRNGGMDMETPRKIIVICPSPIAVPATGDLDERMVRGIELFKVLPKLYADVCVRHGCVFLNAGDFISSSSIDGYHLDENAHKKLAEEIAKLI